MTVTASPNRTSAVFFGYHDGPGDEDPVESCLEATVTITQSIAFGVSACMLLAGSIAFGRQQDRDLSGIHGIPVEGHDIVVGIEIKATRRTASTGPVLTPA